ncbi:MAG TPA: SpoIIE family protein phosphatase [Candidatus Eisenbacteria bacterium]|nr:SpoIIE family protein phosphatase [Candidatus Eisenbacteria bacterium]
MSAPTLQLVARFGALTGRWPLESDALTIGRSSRNPIHLPDPTVSKEHARIVRRDGRWFVCDLGSRNGTRVNGREATEELPIVAGDRLEIGHVPLEVTSESPSRPRLNETVISDSTRLRADQLLRDGGKSGVMPGRMMHVLAEAGRLLVLPRPLRETCEELLAFVEQALPASRYVLLLRDRPGAEPEQIAARTRQARADAPLAMSSAIVRTVLDECTSIITGDAANDPRFQTRQSIVLNAVRSAMAVPLFDNERVLGLLYVDRQMTGEAFGEQDLELLTLLGNMAAVKITNARLLQTEQERLRLAQEAAAATRIQRTLLPQPPRVPGCELDAFLETCHEVGGDLYDFHVGDDGRVTFVLGDVTGKGMPAALLMSSFLSTMRVLFQVAGDLVPMANRLGDLIYRSTDPIHYVTAFIGRLDPATGVLDYVNAGHPPAVIAGPGGLRELPATGLAFGMIEASPYEAERATLAPGEVLAVFSDGIPEAQRGDDFYGSERLYAALRDGGAQPLDALRQRIIDDVRAFTGGVTRGDDITLLLMRRTSATTVEAA